MIDVKEIQSLTKWLKEHPDWCWNYQSQFAEPFMKSVGDDRDGIEKYISSLNVYELNIISGIFEDLYEKWTDDKMWDFIDGLENKLKDAGYQPY